MCAWFVFLNELFVFKAAVISHVKSNIFDLYEVCDKNNPAIFHRKLQNTCHRFVDKIYSILIHFDNQSENIHEELVTIYRITNRKIGEI